MRLEERVRTGNNKSMIKENRFKIVTLEGSYLSDSIKTKKNRSKTRKKSIDTVAVITILRLHFIDRKNRNIIPSQP
jgi:hypothetical protein